MPSPSNFRCLPIASPLAARLRVATHDNAGFAIERRPSDGRFPCRHCLKETPAGDDALLLHHDPKRPGGVYGHGTAIFLCADGCDAFDATDTVPEVVASREVVLRAYAADGRMLYGANRPVTDGQHAEAIRATFADPEVALINVHTLRAGCFLCHVEHVT